MLPKVSGVVRLARDVEVKYTQGGLAIANFSVVSSKKYKLQSGEQREDTTFIDCAVFGRLGEVCNQYLKKGSQIYITGDLKQEKWVAQDGTNRSKHTITIDNMQMLGHKGDGNAVNTQQGYTQPAQQQGYAQPAPAAQPAQTVPDVPPVVDINEDEIPF